MVITRTKEKQNEGLVQIGWQRGTAGAHRYVLSVKQYMARKSKWYNSNQVLDQRLLDAVTDAVTDLMQQ